ncbi:MAG: TonB-dependent siderophore receptor [Acinetobacter sp.]
MKFPINALSLAMLSVSTVVTHAASTMNDVDATAKDETAFNHVNTLATIKLSSEENNKNVSEGSKRYITEQNSASTRLNLSQQETPQTVNVVTRQQMDDFSLNSTRDILKNTPGVTVTGLETNRTTYTARGFNISNILVDGIGFPSLDGYDYFSFDPDGYFYDRIEVIKGADALTNALGSPGATINYVRKRPTKEFQANAGISYGSWDTQRYEADISGALTQDGRIRGRITAFEKAGNSYMDRYSEEKNGIQAILEADLTDTTTASVGYSKLHQYANGSQWGALPLLKNGQPTSYSRSYNFAPSWTYYNYDIDNYFVDLEQKLGDRWKLKLSYEDKSFYNSNKMLYINTKNNIDYLYPEVYNQKIRNQNANINLEGKFDLFGRTHDAVLGYNWAEYNEKYKVLASEEMVNFLATFPEDPTLLIPTSVQPSDSYAEPTWYQINDWKKNGYSTLKTFYGATRLNIDDKLKVILGVSHNQLDYIAYQGAAKYQKNKLSPYAGITYNFTPQYTGYMSYTSIFLPNGSKIDTSGQAIGPKEGKSYEIGLKTSWLDRRLTGSFAVFRTTQDNYTVDSGQLSGATTLYNVYSVKAQGIELGLAGKVSDHLDVILGYTKYALKSRLNGADPSPNLPKQSFSLLTAYTLPQVPQLKLGVSVQWQDDIRDTAYASIHQDAYALLNLMASYQLNDHILLQANANNVTDKKYLTGLSGGQGLYGAPANYTVAVKFKY